ncbi:hypothetical protein DKU33_09470 [Salmonella enterica subsp. enterica serovar Newport]|nr:hypothetical protein [Salmonella enterica subsp. enterica serovar Newport]
MAIADEWHQYVKFLRKSPGCYVIFLRNRNARRSHATGRSTRAGEEAEDPLNRMMSNYALWPRFSVPVILKAAFHR